MIFLCESCLKGKQLTLNPRQVHMKNNISYLLWLFVLQLGCIIPITDIDMSKKKLIVLYYIINMICYFHVNLIQRENSLH